MATKDQEDSARLILMEYFDHAPSVVKFGVSRIIRPRLIPDFIQPMRILHSSLSSLAITELWIKYMGLDGRSMPTHCFRCGRGITRLNNHLECK